MENLALLLKKRNDFFISLYASSLSCCLYARVPTYKKFWYKISSLLFLHEERKRDLDRESGKQFWLVYQKLASTGRYGQYFEQYKIKGFQYQLKHRNGKYHSY